MDGHRLLIVEDDAGIRDSLRAYYVRSGWEVRAAGTVAEGLTSLDAGAEPCCLILDLKLPDGDGKAILERVRSKGFKTRVAVCTGSVDLAQLRKVALLKPDAMLSKPIRLPEVWTEPCRVCEGQGETERGRCEDHGD